MAKKESMRKRAASPTLKLLITDEQYLSAVQAASGACLIADAIRQQYPHLTGVSVDMATIRVTDRAKGYRYTYLTREDAQSVLLHFDQGWSNPCTELTIGGAVKVTIVKAPNKQTPERRAARLAELEAKAVAGEPMTKYDRSALTRMRKADEIHPPRTVTSAGSPVVVENRGAPSTVVGGPPLKLGADHPNLLRSRNRLFGARTSQPATPFREAVDQAVAERLAELAERAAVPAAADPRKEDDTAAGGDRA